MKKLLFIAMLALGLTANAQEGSFNVGANLGLATGDSSDGYGLTFSLEANYLFSVADQFEVGPSVSYLTYVGDEIGGFEVENASFMPIAAAGRYAVSETFTVGLDLGYGIGLSPDGIDSGLYYRPLVGYQVTESIMIQAAYSGISLDGSTASNVSLGAVFGL